jgi:DNA-binding CsgD family transcriptional regulator
LAVHTEDPADGHPPQQGTPSITPNPTSPWDSYWHTHTLDLMRTNQVDRVRRARKLAIDAGALSTVATLYLQLAASSWLALDAPGCLDAARRSQHAAHRRDLGLVLAEALLMEAGAHAIAGRRVDMERAISDATAVGRPEPELQAAACSRRAMWALLRENRERAVALYDKAVSIDRSTPAAYRRTYWYSWALLRTVQDVDGDRVRNEVRRVTPTGDPLAQAFLDYGDAIAAGRRGEKADAEALFDAARSRVHSPGMTAQRYLAERHVAECALADGWGRPTVWLVESSTFFREAGQVNVERACRSLLRRAGVTLPRRVHGHRDVPPALAALGITDREADVLGLIAEGLTNRQIGQRLFISPRTVDKHVERLITKTGTTRRADLREFST